MHAYFHAYIHRPPANYRSDASPRETAKAEAAFTRESIIELSTSAKLEDNKHPYCLLLILKRMRMLMLILILILAPTQNQLAKETCYDFRTGAELLRVMLTGGKIDPISPEGGWHMDWRASGDPV